MSLPDKDLLSQLSLPPGFRFYPTDEELLVQYLCKKVAGHQFSLQIIAEIDLYKFDPWVLPSKAMFGEKEWYFFSPRDRKYPNGSRPNRVAGSGYWKATGTDKLILTEGRRVGIKKALVFYIGKAPKGTKTNWIMHEYRLLDSNNNKNGTSLKLDEWVLCRIYKKTTSTEKMRRSTGETSNNVSSSSSSSCYMDDVLESLPELDDHRFALPPIDSYKTGTTEFDWANLAGLNSVPQFVTQPPSQAIPSYSNGGMYVPTTGTEFRHVDSGKAEEEVQSGFSNQLVDNLGSYVSQGFGANSVDSFGFTHPSHMGGYGGFRQ